MKCLAATLAVVLLCVGCAPDVDGAPVVETQVLDCDLIFPGPSSFPGGFDSR